MVDKSLPELADIFIVHGHDADLLKAVKDLLDTANKRTPLVLAEQPSGGKTIIEKLEEYGPKAGYAVVLMSPDDVGRKDLPDTPEQKRARQNVIFEIGYFMGLLGRGRVCLLLKGDVEFPSDLQGIVYIGVDEAGVWRKQLLDEIGQVISLETRRVLRALGV